MSLAAIHNLDHTVLLCADIAAMRAFYRDLLGLPVEVDHGGWVTFRCGGTRLSLKARGRGLAGDDGAPAPHDSASVQLAFRVPPAALDGCVRELQAAGIALAAGPVEVTSWRHRAIFFRDPEANVLEIYAEV